MRSNRLIAVMALILSCFTLTSCNDDDDNNNGAEKENNGGKAEIKVNNNGHEYTDLGLSVYWATCNVGAYSPTTQGNKYAFGETSTKNEYTNSNYVGGNEDVAKQIWGGDWRLPTRMELEELVEKCSWARRTVNGIQVVTATGPNGNSIDLPYYSYIQNEGYYGWYWSSTASTNSKAYCMRFKGNEIGVGTNEKYNGFLTRGVMTNPNYSGFNNNSDERCVGYYNRETSS